MTFQKIMKLIEFSKTCNLLKKLISLLKYALENIELLFTILPVLSLNNFSEY